MLKSGVTGEDFPLKWIELVAATHIITALLIPCYCSLSSHLKLRRVYRKSVNPQSDSAFAAALLIPITRSTETSRLPCLHTCTETSQNVRISRKNFLHSLLIFLQFNSKSQTFHLFKIHNMQSEIFQACSVLILMIMACRSWILKNQLSENIRVLRKKFNVSWQRV